MRSLVLVSVIAVCAAVAGCTPNMSEIASTFRSRSEAPPVDQAPRAERTLSTSVLANLAKNRVLGLAPQRLALADMR